MKKNFRKPIKSLMLTAMALLTATATAVNASSYSNKPGWLVNVTVEHIWDDNNNAGNTRPVGKDENGDLTGGIEENIYQIKGDGSDGEKTLVGTVTDNGYEEGERAGQESQDTVESVKDQGYQDGLQAVEDLKNNPDGWDTPKNPDELKKPENLKSPDEIDEREDLTEEEKAQYREQYEQYQKDYADYVSKFESYEEAKKAYYENANKTLPGGADVGFLMGFNGGAGTDKPSAEELNGAYNQGFEEGIQAGLNGEKPKEDASAVDRDALVDDIKKGLEEAEQENLSEETIKDIANKVEELVNDTAVGNLWALENIMGGELKGSTDEALGEDGQPAGDPLNYRAELTQDSKDALEAAGYETKEMRIEITLIKETVTKEDGTTEEVQRVYVSIDGGENWVPGNAETEASGKPYNPNEDYVEATKITFLHTLKPQVPEMEMEPDEPEVREHHESPEDPKDPKDPKDPRQPENPIPEDGVPLADVEEEPEESIPEEEVPLTDVPKTGDSSLIWMCAAMFSGTALLALLKKEKEAQEA